MKKISKIKTSAKIKKNDALNILEGDNLKILESLPKNHYQLIYIDPPFNTKRKQKLGENSYEDSFDDFIEFIKPRLIKLYSLLSSNGSLFVHLDYREVHYVKMLLDQIFGRGNFMNEIIWSYDFGGRSTKKWSAKHDTILWYVKDPKNYQFNYSQIDRIPYMAPGFQTKERAKLGKTPTDVWWNTIVHTTGKERVGYPTQKPLAILERIVKVHSKPGDNLLDVFAGSGSFGEAALLHGRNVTLVDSNPKAITVIKKRLAKFPSSTTRK